ncbi:MAG: non-homologous end-joining DNA ligase [Bacillota bacterium]
MTLPLFRPMLAFPSEPFSSDEYIFEIKWDGYRCLAYLDGGTVLRSRNLIDLTPVFPELSRLNTLARSLPVIVDGEIVVTVDGKPSFSVLQRRGHLSDPQRIMRVSKETPALFVAFDILYRKGRPVMAEPVEARREMLREILSNSSSLVVSDYVVGNGEEFFRACTAAGIEGMIAKKLGSPYLPGKRSVLWRKVRSAREADLVVCGWEEGQGRRKLGALILGAYQEETLVFQGKVGSGFSENEEGALLKALAKIAVRHPPLPVPRDYPLRHAHWVQPLLVCKVKFTEITADGYLRHPSYQGLRWDKEPRECSVVALQTSS